MGAPDEVVEGLRYQISGVAREEKPAGCGGRGGFVPSGPPMPSLEKLLAMSIADLRVRFLEKGASVPRGLLEALEADARNGAHELVRRIRGRRFQNRAEGQRLRNLLKYEMELWTSGVQHIAGVDEAGMAPLAGPVVAGAVILPRGYKLRDLDDSKKILDEAKREELAAHIRAEAICWSTGHADVAEIDRINIYHAGLLAMRRAVMGLSRIPEYVLVDARRIPE